MRFTSGQYDRALQSIMANDRLLASLTALARNADIEIPEYRNLAARFLNLKAQILRSIGSDAEASACERLAASQFAVSDAWAGCEESVMERLVPFREPMPGRLPIDVEIADAFRRMAEERGVTAAQIVDEVPGATVAIVEITLDALIAADQVKRNGRHYFLIPQVAE